MYDRTSRIAEEIRKEISSIIRMELKDPRLSELLSITGVKVTRDLKYANVYVSVFGDEEKRNSAIAALKKAAGFIRRQIGNRIKLRYTPELIFEIDNSIEHGVYMMNLINKTVK